MSQLSFNVQKYRKDILSNMLANLKLSGKEMFDLIMMENTEVVDERRQGWIYESLCQILIVLKCVQGLNYSEILEGQLQNLTQVKNINVLLKLAIDGGGNNIVDLTIKQGSTTIPFSIKYKNKHSETDVSKIDNTITKQKLAKDYKIGLFVKNKVVVINHKYHNKLNIDKQLHDKIIDDGLLFDEQDIIRALSVFIERFSNNILSINDFIEFINAEYLLSPRQELIKKLHQAMTLMKFIKSFLTNKHKMWCIAHKPRSGKSITILLICKYLLECGYKKILIMTPVIATIDSFTKDLENYIDFKDINYKTQEDFNIIDETFNGIVFCSVQYLKTDSKKKKELLQKMNFDAIITDEAHQGSSTDKTKTEILDVVSDIEEIRKNIKLNIFASGTADKTKKYYGIHNSCSYEWEVEDESYMKELKISEVKNKEDIINYMVNRHGPIFSECLKNETLNKDYSKHPSQVLMKHSIHESLINDIIKYNAHNGTNFGYNCASLLALNQIINKKGEVIYEEVFELCKTTDGEAILKEFFDSIISTQKMKISVMKQIEQVQSSRGSRKSTIENPLLFIVYLPTNTRNNTISLLQKTLKSFLEKHKIWSDYNIEYSNGTEDTADVKQQYNEFIQTIMNKTKTQQKKGCILFLGNKGSVGITYKECDVTISLDDGHNIDNQKQRFSRALTEADGKTVGINVDMNIQRTYLYLLSVIQNHRRNTKTIKTNAEILYYLNEHNIFLFDPQQINNGKLTTIEIMSYYQKVAENIMKEIDDTPLLENIICDDDMRDFIKIDFQKRESKKINKDLDGEQQHCPEGDVKKHQVDAPNLPDDTEDPDNEKEQELTPEETEKIELLVNQTYEMCKSFLFPLLALISRSYNLFDFKEVFTNEKTEGLIILLLKEKLKLKNIKIDIVDNFITIVNIMNNIIDNNAEIVNNIREIYSIASANMLRQLIAKHFIPTANEKKDNAEVPTPVKLVDEMLDTISLEFWSSPNKVFEPCCGKGNFVLGIFDRFYKGLEAKYPNNIDRCKVIMRQCIYYADLTALNVLITTEVLKCHIQSYCGLDELDYTFNQYTGDTLKLDIKKEWNLTGFDAVIGNPPYSTDPSKPNTKSLYDKFIEKYISNKLLLFVVPSRWFTGGKGLDKFRDFMIKRKDIVFIQHEDIATKWFGKNVDIEGGVNYFLKDKSYNGACLFNSIPYDLNKYDCIIKPKYHKIIDIVILMESISKLYMGRCFGVETNDNRFKNDGKIKCYVSLQKSKDRCKYIDAYEFNEKNTFWKVITTEANGKNPNFGEKFIGKPNEIHSGSYISFRVNNEEEAKSLLSYLDTKFANHMLSVRKISQHINGDVCKWIPLVPLDRIWNDDKVCEYLKIEQNMYV
jgi:site-specific DNA-methyltransferase (adenine-specific)